MPVYSRGEGATVDPYEGNEEAYKKHVSFGAGNLSDLPFVVDFSAKRLWRQKPTGDRLIEHRLWTLVSLFVSVSGDRAFFKAGGLNKDGFLQPFVGQEIVSLAGMQTAKIVKALREEDRATIQAFGEEISKGYKIIVKTSDGRTRTINIEFDS